MSTSSRSPATDKPLVAVLDYDIGNLRSAQKWLERAGADARLTNDPGLIADAVGVVLPGVGHFSTCMAQLRGAGLEQPAMDAVASHRPFLGICVGMQMLFDGSEEAPEVRGLGVLPGTSRLIRSEHPVPHMQWNRLDVSQPGCELLVGLPEQPWVYFVHSYAVETDATHIVASCEYGPDLTAMVQLADSAWATQFHPEKSGEVGQLVAENFMRVVRERSVANA
jgi:imidazole glycerol-phosphate synthase subunit HisH